MVWQGQGRLSCPRPTSPKAALPRISSSAWCITSLTSLAWRWGGTSGSGKRPQDFREDLLELLRPPSLESDPQTVFLRALLELYEGDLDDDAPLPKLHTLAAFQRDGLARAKRILDDYGGVLYADGVGMGKTEIGVELAREHAQDKGEHVLIISPAQLRDGLWKQRLSEGEPFLVR